MIYIMIISNIYIEIKKIVFFCLISFFITFFIFLKLSRFNFLKKIFNDQNETYLYISMNIYKILFIYNLILKFHFPEISNIVFYQNDFD